MIIMIIIVMICNDDNDNKHDDNNSNMLRVCVAFVGVDDMLDPNERVSVWSITLKLTACP